MVARTMMSESHTIISQIIPQKLGDQIASKFNALFGSISSQREFYKRIGKAWKRGYLLYGPPGTGKSSSVAAMAEYLKLNIYDLELTSVQTNSALRTMLLSTTHRSIIVIEDIDCSAELQDRKNGGYDGGNSQVGSSAMIYTNGFNLALISEDNVDKKLAEETRAHGQAHVHDLPDSFWLRYSDLKLSAHHSPSPFQTHPRPYNRGGGHAAEIAEHIMKSDDVDVALESVVEFVNDKKRKKMGKECGSEVIEKTGQIPQQEPSEKERSKRRRKRQGR